MKKLLLIIPNLGTGGAQNVFRDQLRFYSRHVTTVGVVFNWDGALPEDRELGVISLNVPGGGNLFSKSLNFLRRIQRLKRIKSANSITHSISHLEGADYINILSRRGEHIFCWIHGTKRFDGEIRGVVGWLRKKIMMPLLYRRSKVVTVSEGIRAEMINTFGIDPSKVATIFNGFDIAAITARKTEPANVPTGPILVTHCRLAPQKNLHGLIKIFTWLKQSHAVKLVIVGDGELRDELISHATSLHLSVFSVWRNDAMNDSYDIYFIGRQSNPYSIISRGTVYVMTSAWEGFPLALGEALSCGVPAVAADCFTGPREMLAPGFMGHQPIDQPMPTEVGMLMPLADTDQHVSAWVQTLARLLDDARERAKYSEAAVRRMSDLDYRQITKKWLELIGNE